MLRETLFLLQLLSQNPQNQHQQDPFDIPDISLEPDSAKLVDTTETKAESKTKDSNFKISFGGQLGNPAGYNLDLSTSTEYKDLSINISPYLKTEINSKYETVGLGTIIGVKYGIISVSPALEIKRGSFSSTDTTETSRNLSNAIENGMSWQNITEQEISNLENMLNGTFAGIGLELKDGKQKINFEISHTGRTNDNKIKTTQHHNEVYRDSIMTNEGIIVVTKDSLLYNILTNNQNLTRTEENINRWGFTYERAINDLIALGGGAILQHNKIKYDTRNKTNVITKINGETKVIVYGNQTDSTIIPVSVYEESQNNSRIVDRDQINTDMLNFIFHINGTKNPNNRLYFDIGFFNSENWQLKDIFNFEAKNFNGSLQPYISNGGFGGRLFLAKQLLPLPLNLADYAFKNEELARNVALNEEQKRIIEKYNYYRLLQELLGPFVDIDLEKIGSDWKFNSKLGYVIWGYGGLVDFDSYRGKQKIGVEALINSTALKAYFGWDNNNNKYFGVGASFGLR